VRRTHPFVDVPYPVVMAHQGSCTKAPGNTLPAFEIAVREGADVLETDMHWTKDGFVVLCHDDTVDRTSDGKGRIADFTLAELKQLDFGYRFTQDGGKTYPYRGRGIQIPTLRELILAFPDIRINVDVKPRHPVYLQRLIREVCELGAESRILIASFHHCVLQRLRALNSSIATSASVCETGCFLASVWTGLGNQRSLPFAAFQVPITAYGVRVVTKRFVECAHRAGKKVHVWTVDEPRTMVELLKLGVDGIVTNRPDVAVQARQQFLTEAHAS
jgi:glycerophosphoryl diester phosphodiesterase